MIQESTGVQCCIESHKCCLAEILSDLYPEEVPGQIDIGGEFSVPACSSVQAMET